MEESETAPTPEKKKTVTRRRGRRVRRRWIGAALLGALIGAGGVVLLSRPLAPGVVPQIHLSGGPPPVTEKVTLFFADPRWTQLVPEEREIQPQSEVTAKIRTLVEALADGPRGGEAPVLPKGTSLRNVYVGKDGLAVIDFDSNETGLGAGGVSGELLTVFSLVQTICENVQGVQAVQILVGGKQHETLAGHVKISEPLRPDPRWISGDTKTTAVTE